MAPIMGLIWSLGRGLSVGYVLALLAASRLPVGSYHVLYWVSYFGLENLQPYSSYPKTGYGMSLQVLPYSTAYSLNKSALSPGAYCWTAR